MKEIDESTDGQYDDQLLEKQADALYREKSYEEELSIYEEALRYSPKTPSLYIKGGNCLRKQGQYEAALRSYEQAIEIEPRSVAAYNGICYTYIYKRDYEKAWDSNLLVLSFDPQNATAYNCRGRILCKQKKIGEALEAFEQAIQWATSANDLAGYYYNKGLALLELNQYDKAIDAYFEALRRGSENSKPKQLYKDFPKEKLTQKSSKIFKEGEGLFDAGKYEKALYVFDLVLRFDDAFKHAYIRKGNALLALERYQDAYEALEKAATLFPDNIRVLATKGKALLGLKKYGEAVSCFGEAISLQPKHVLAHIGRGDALLNLGDYQRALEDYNEAIRLEPQRTQAYAKKGHAHYALHDEIAAFKAYEDAIHHGTNDAECYNNSGEILASLGHYKDAEKMYNQALHVAPDLVSVHFRRGNAFFELKRYKEALASYQQVVILNDEDSAAYMSMGDVLTGLGSGEEATKVYNKAFELVQTTQYPDLLWHLANLTSASLRPIDRQFEIWKQFIASASWGDQVKQVLQNICKLYEYLFDPLYVPIEKLQMNVQKLAHVLKSLSDENRTEALLYITGDSIRTVQMLIALKSFSVTGLEPLVHKLIKELKPESRADDLFNKFYSVLDNYGVRPEDAAWLYSQILVLERRYAEAYPILTDLARNYPVPDNLWLLIEVLEKLNVSSESQLQSLQNFIAIAPFSERHGLAWEQIGQLYEQQQNIVEAINSYEKAELFGLEIQRLHDYRAGCWEAIPYLQTHVDFVFPPVIVIDLECDYQPDAHLGSTVFEVGAVCIKGLSVLDTYQAVIRRDSVSRKVAHRQHEAKPLEQVMEELRAFIEQSQQSVHKAIIVGHNFQAFDAPHLRALGLPVKDDQIIDTLTFARLLHPDSMQHNLSLLCEFYDIPLEEAHQALPDARACAHLLHALGNELVVRGDTLLAGFRTFVPPDSAFDRVVLQPRNQAASPDHTWKLNPMPVTAHPLVLAKSTLPSPQILQAIKAGDDAFVERFDPEGMYAGYLPTTRKTVVAVATRRRLERLLAAAHERSDLFVLPDPGTLLCPHRLYECIEQEGDPQMKLELFCLYQASHNHDASTLYPLRLPSNPVTSSLSGEEVRGMRSGDDAIQWLKQTLLESCCTSDMDHSASCSAHQAVRKAIETSIFLLSTHENFFHQSPQLTGDLLIVDDLEDLQMHFAEYLVERVMDQELLHQSNAIHDFVSTFISSYVNTHLSTLAFHERLPLSNIEHYVFQSQDGDKKSLLPLLQKSNNISEPAVNTLARFFQANGQRKNEFGHACAYWLDLHFTFDQKNSDKVIEQWSFCGLNRNLRQAFTELCWQPFRQHILCGAAITLGTSGTQFLQNFFGLSEKIPFLADKHVSSKIYIPSKDIIRPSSFLGRRLWAESAGTFLYRLALASNQSLAVTLHSSAITEALANTFHTHAKQIHHCVVAPHLGWTTTKINDYLIGDGDPTIAFVSPYLRKVALSNQVCIEVTGPLCFLNQQDPLVVAQMRVFAALYPKIAPFTSYLLPQALLELKARTASQADIHIILDSALNDAVYRDEVSSLFEGKVLDRLPEVSANTYIPDEFIATLSEELDRQGHASHIQVNNEDLYDTLRTYWQEESFRSSPLNQKEIIENVFVGKDQLVVAATGGGKSLCFQLPAILQAQDVIPKVTLVISPLIALMQDQVESLRRKGVFSAILWNSTLTQIEKGRYLQGIKQGDYSIIYIAPEQVYSASLLDVLLKREIGLIAIDEAHCVSLWGHGFRDAYFRLREWINDHICEKRQRAFPLLALTATARKGHYATNEKSTIEDIIEKLDLNLKSKDVKLTSPERPELELRVEHIGYPCPDCQYLSLDGPGEVKCERCQHRFLIEKEAIRKAKIKKLIDLLDSFAEDGLRRRWDQPFGKRQRGIIYCRTREETKNVCQDIQAACSSLRIGRYHAGLKNELNNVYHKFTSDDDDGLDIVVATNAFGMGIDARRLGFVIHFDIPSTLEAYYQEAGRAGRDPEFRDSGNRAQCILLYHKNDLEGNRWLNNRNRITEWEIEAIYKTLYKLRNPGQQEILVTENKIQLLSGLGTKGISSYLYCLEHYTQVHSNPVLKRRENAEKPWQLKFEQGYLQRLRDPALSSRSKELANIFCSSPDFKLSEDRTVVIDANELATNLGWDLATVESEQKNLIKRHIIASVSNIYIKWNTDKEDAAKLLEKLMNCYIRETLNSANDPRMLLGGKAAKVSIHNLYASGKVTGIPLQNFIFFLSELAKKDAGDLRLFVTFSKTVDDSQNEWYSLQLEKPSDAPIKESVIHTRKKIYEQLYQVIQRFGCDVQDNEWRYIDLLKEAPDYIQRQDLARSLTWLKTLGLLIFPQQDVDQPVMRIEFLQDKFSPDALEVDLASYRLVERYNERKIAIMHEYAMSSAEQRRQLLRAYFWGEKPLIEPFVPLSNLTEQQKTLAMHSDGYHLIKGPAGSGKTTILQEHFRYLVEHLSVPNDRILVVAHYHGAVDRIENHLEPLQNAMRPIPVKTLQSLGEHIFRDNRELLMGVDRQSYFPKEKKIRVSSGEEKAFISEALSRLHREVWILDCLPVGIGRDQFAKTYVRNDEIENDCLEAISLFRALGVFPACISNIEEVRLILKNAGKSQRKLDFFYAAYISYQLLQREYGTYTFDDQILFALAILRANPDSVKQWQSKYEHIIVDEFQDLKPAGAELIERLSHKHRNVLAVGDVNQRIVMSFSEEIGLDETFKPISGENLFVHHLTTNFRSVQEILDLAHAVFPQTLPQVSARGYRGIKPICIDVDPVLILEKNGVTRTNTNILEIMIDITLSYIDTLPPEDAGSVALLAAKSHLSKSIQMYLQRKDRPFAVLEHKHHYQSSYAQRYLVYLRLIQDRNQTNHIEHLLKHCVSPYFRVDQVTQLKNIAERCGQTLLETALDLDAIKNIKAEEELVSSLQKHIEVIRRYTADSICEDIWLSIKLLLQTPEILSEEQGQTETLVDENEEIEAMLKELGKKTVQEALEYVDNFITFVDTNKLNRKLIVSTIDHAKSQEFDTVFLLGADQLQHRGRWYVSITRARQRFFALVDVSFSNKDKILASDLNGFFDVLPWQANCHANRSVGKDMVVSKYNDAKDQKMRA